MISFKEYINELKVGSQIDKYLDLIKKELKSKTIEQEVQGDKLVVKYDTIALVFDKQGYLVGFIEGEETYSVDKSLKSIKDLKLSTAKKFFGRRVKSTKDLKKPEEVVHIYFPKEKDELQNLVKELIKERGNKADLNDIDVSGVEEMNYMFHGTKFNGDISKWDVSNVRRMYSMFENTPFNGDISKWDVSKLERTHSMFKDSSFNGDISKWDVSEVIIMDRMFQNSKFNRDISKWDVSNVSKMPFMFKDSSFNGDISKWDASEVFYAKDMFKNSPLEGNEPEWYKQYKN